ncbi:MAG TPA: DUF1996 domain-containing protein [Streptosporangiaceae bacterium]
MQKPLRALLVPAILLGALFALPASSQASSPGWLLKCALAKSLPDDPIVHPGMPGMSHLHDFFGNTSVIAASTYQSMRAAASTCPAGDTAGYWVPAVFRNGVKVAPAGDGVREQIYYRANNLAPGTHIEPFPPDLRVVAGNSHATSASENPKLGKEIYWGCSDNSVGGKLTVPPSSCPTGIISLHVGFPNCWDGKLTHVDDTAHLRYPSGGTCPSGFPHALPRLILRNEYPVGTTTGTITLASGATFTAHGDFWNTWDQAKLEHLVDTCLNAGMNCGTFKGSTSGTSTTSGGAAGSLMAMPQHHSSASKAVASPTPAAAASSARVVEPPATSEPASQGGLPVGGAQTSTLLVLAVVLLCIGASAVVAARHRYKARH